MTIPFASLKAKNRMKPFALGLFWLKLQGRACHREGVVDIYSVLEEFSSYYKWYGSAYHA